MILLADSKGPDQTARACSLIWAFAVRTCSEGILSLGRPHFKPKMQENSSLPINRSSANNKKHAFIFLISAMFVIVASIYKSYAWHQINIGSLTACVISASVLDLSTLNIPRRVHLLISSSDIHIFV